MIHMAIHFFSLAQRETHTLTPAHLPYNTDTEPSIPLSVKLQPNSAPLQVEVR